MLHESWVLRGVLNEQPGGVGAVFADEGFSGPAVLVDNFLYPHEVAAVDFKNGVKVGSAKGAAAHALVGIAHLEQFLTQRFIKRHGRPGGSTTGDQDGRQEDRKSTRLNSSH